ncbi:MAG: TonB-dependent siderophore receptor [Cyanosarcina radialis HA8281-LM2]|jgi:iron complex outermembrane receptor protein|nr:TonB-dependent siderophore receptor [Cyanosarcina radialis HA8281-LM2]
MVGARTNRWSLRLLVLLLWAIIGLPARSQEVAESDNIEKPSSEENAISLPLYPTAPPQQTTTPYSLSDRDRPATTVKEWITQIEASLVQITGVRVEKTDTGLQVILETQNGTLPVPETQSLDKATIADLPNATIAEEFSQANPIQGIALVSVTRLPGDKVRVVITGTNAPPVAQVTSEARGLVFAVTQEDEIQVVVTGEQDEGYNPSRASTATRTDTPIRDIPQSIQVVPRQVIEDRGVQRGFEALETVSGVFAADTRRVYAGTNAGIRGFLQYNRLRNGLPGEGRDTFTPIGTIEQIEVLKGPASVLFGALEPGGVVNVVTRQPLAEPYYKIGLEVGNYGFYQPSIDLSGPLTEDESVLYRLIAAYQSGGSFRDYTSIQDRTISIAPSLSFKLGDRTNLNLYYEYADIKAGDLDEPILSDGRLIPIDVNPHYLSSATNQTHKAGYTFTHEFNDNLQLRHSFSASFARLLDTSIEWTDVLDDRFLVGFYPYSNPNYTDRYFGLIDLVGKFKTGSISHQLVAGFDFNRDIRRSGFVSDSVDLPPLDIFNPNYNIPLPEIPSPAIQDISTSQTYGVYLQDQIAFSDRLKMLIGGRYDWTTNESGPIDGDKTSQSDGAFSPRIGLVYQPSKTVSLYASYSQSFLPTIGRNPDNEPFEPTRGTQYEVGVKTDFFDGKLSTTLAAYHLTKTNVLTPNPDPDLAREGFSVQVGEQRSRGIELDVAGEILPGWKIIASYALTDAEVTKDNNIPSTIGRGLPNTPLHQASLWTTYTIQSGDLQGLGFGLGLFYVGDQTAYVTGQTDGYFRTDAALYYRRDRLNAAINVRNLFNTDYITGSSFTTLYVERGKPLTIVGSVSWEF